MNLHTMLEKAVSLPASDIFIIAGLPLSVKTGGKILRLTEEKLTPETCQIWMDELYREAGSRSREQLNRTGDDDFSITVPRLARFRVSAFKQRGALSAVVRVVNFEIPDAAALSIPPTVLDLAKKHKGMILVTGMAGSGKTTTLACMVDAINKTRDCHIITIEDPIEYLHRHCMSIVTQREIMTDTESYLSALRAALRQSLDVILVGEMRDYETISTAVTAAETGHLILSTLHTVGAANTVDRIIDVFPAEQQHQIRFQLSMVLEAVISQQLLPGVDGGMLPAFEIMTANSAVRNMIREAKTHQLDTVIHSSAGEGMCSMDNSILALYNQGKIAKEVALLYSANRDTMEKRMAASGGRGAG